MSEPVMMTIHEPSVELDMLARRVIGAAIEVHRHLGPGFLESIYEEALAVELDLLAIPFARQVGMEICYKGGCVGQYRLDFLVDQRLVIEIKAIEGFTAVHEAQLLAYLKATKLHLGLLINFNTHRLRDGVRRLIFSQ